MIEPSPVITKKLRFKDGVKFTFTKDEASNKILLI